MKRVRIVLLIAALAAGGFWLWRRVRGPGPLILSGAIEANSVEAGSLVGGRIRSVQVVEGESVAAGAVIVTFEPDLMDRQIDAQKAALAGARAGLDKTLSGPRREELHRAQIDWDTAERDRMRVQALLTQNLTDRRQYDDAAAKAATLLETYRQLQRGARGEDISAARAEFDRQAAQLAYLLRQREELTVRAPVAGVIEIFDKRPGDLIAPNAPVATLLEIDQRWVRVYVPEPRLGEVKVGTAARIRVDSWPGKSFPGRVAQIRQQAEYTPRNVQTLDQRFDQVFAVKITLEPAPELKPGMAATVELAP
jgi:HlyD family secretion protein